MNTLIISLLLIFLGVVLIWSCIDDRRANRELWRRFNKLKPGDKVKGAIRSINSNPFEEDVCEYDIEIIDKKIGKDGIPYVKYKYSDGSVGYSNFYDFPFKTK